jgi:peroxiredoxin Q/BCP
MIETGRSAPEFVIETSTAKTLSLADFSGRWLVLYFYPQAETPACTTEARDFSERADEFSALGARVLGISRDPVAKLARFAAKQGLELTLGSDAGGTCEAYEAWGEKQLYGRRYMGILRLTYLIDPTGQVRAAWKVTRVKGHAEEVLGRLRELQA